MKVKLLFTILFLYTISLSAKEGMWLPFLLEKMNQKEMKSMGLKITAKDIYDVKNGSLKDAVVIFGGGCTGEVISNKGLVLTNHHCGYGTVQGLSSLQNNYLLKGFWAKNQQEELPCPGLSVTFIANIIEVSDKVKAGVASNMNDTTKNKIIQKNIDSLEKQYQRNTGYIAQVKSFYFENEYYLFLMEKFTDIRLVGFPPNGIGKFGGDTDNWAWPRHTGDFGLFRIYANKQNKPAVFDKENIPYTPKKSFKINIKGIQENDFTMVYGFPGRSTEYLSSAGVAEVMNILDPARILLRENRLNIMERDMKSSEEIFIKYASKQSGIANYYKKWKGELLGLQINNAIVKKQEEEKQFMKWVNLDNERKNKYEHLLQNIEKNYEAHQANITLNEYINEAIWASELVKKASMYDRILQTIDTLKSMDGLEIYTKELKSFYKSINKNTDFKITQSLYKIFSKDMKTSHLIDENTINDIYENSYISDTNKFESLMKVISKEDIKTLIKQDIAYKTYSYYDSVQKNNLSILKKSLAALNGLYSTYILALKEYNMGKQFYPDANFTLRLTYGKVEGATPQDGMKYTYYTTLDGAVRKHNEAIEEFTMPKKLLDLYESKDYGQYSILHNGVKTVPLAFLASNHTTGGNSGSPVLNANGELIGTNFDRIWEGTMSDILFDPNLCRNISVDIRYTLFIIEKFGGARWVIDELNIVK